MCEISNIILIAENWCRSDLYNKKSSLPYSVSTSTHMLKRAIWDKFPVCIFENFEIARVKQGQFQIFQKLRGWFIPKIPQNKHVITS